MKLSILICTLLVSVLLTAQTPLELPTNYFYLGTDLGVSFLRSSFEYTESYVELSSDKQFSKVDWLHSRLHFGYNTNIHRVEFSMQNLPIKTGFALKFNTNNIYSEHLRKGATLLSFTYLIQPYKIKWFSFNLGPHIGIAFSGKSDFGDYEEYTSTTMINNVVTDVMLIKRTTIRKHQTFFNFGGRFNLLFEVSPKIELLLNTSVLYTPYQVRGFELYYQLNRAMGRNTQSSSKVLNYTAGIGLNYRFLRKNE